MKGTTTTRGYGSDHAKARAYWQPIVATGQVQCATPRCLHAEAGHGRTIHPGQAWHLDHLPDRSGYRGPSHARCNTSDGARRGNKARGIIAAYIRVATPSRRW